LRIGKPPSGGFFICNLAETSEAPARSTCGAKAVDSKTRAYSREGGPRNVGESYLPRQEILLEKFFNNRKTR